MVILIDERRIEKIINRLCNVGLAKSVAGALFDLPRSSTYYLSDHEDTELEGQGFGEETRASLRLVDRAAELIRKGYPLDLVSQVTRIRASKLISFLDEAIDS